MGPFGWALTGEKHMTQQSLSQELAEETARRYTPASFALARITAVILLLLALAVNVDWLVDLPRGLEGMFDTAFGWTAMVALMCIHMLCRLRVKRRVLEQRYRE